MLMFQPCRVVTVPRASSVVVSLLGMMCIRRTALCASDVLYFPPACAKREMCQQQLQKKIIIKTILKKARLQLLPPPPPPPTANITTISQLFYSTLGQRYVRDRSWNSFRRKLFNKKLKALIIPYLPHVLNWWGVCEYVIVHTNLSPNPVTLWI